MNRIVSAKYRNGARGQECTLRIAGCCIGGKIPTRKPSAERVTEAMIDRAVQASGWFVTPHVAPRECGVPIECDLSEADAAQLNKEMRDELRGILEAALSEASK